MTQTSYTGETLFSAEHPHITKHVSVFSILLSSVIALLGIAAIVVSISMDQTSDTLSMAILTLGTLFILVALYRLFWKSTEVVYLPTGSLVSEGSCYLDSNDLPEMNRMIENKYFSLSSKMAFRQTGNGRLDYLVSKDRQFAAVQLFRFVPYTYEPASQVYYYTGDDAVSFIRYLNTRNI